MYWIVGSRGLLGRELIRACISENLPFMGIVKNGSTDIKTYEATWDDIFTESNNFNEPIVLINAAGQILNDTDWTLSNAVKSNVEPLLNCLMMIKINSNITLCQISSSTLSRPAIKSNKSKYYLAKQEVETLTNLNSKIFRNRISLVRLPTLLDFNYKHSELISALVQHLHLGLSFVPRFPRETLEMLPSGRAAINTLDLLRGEKFHAIEIPGLKILVEKFVEIFSLIYFLSVQSEEKNTLTAETIIENYPDMLFGIDEKYLPDFLSFLLHFMGFIRFK